MYPNRPKIKVAYKPLDIIIESTAISLFIFLIIYTIIMYQGLPDTIPTHFNFKGEVDNYGNKSTLFLLPIIGVATYILLFVVNRYPHIHNYMVDITEENALKNYRFSTRIVRYTNLFVALVFAIIQYTLIQSAMGTSVSIGNWLLPIIIGASIIIPVILIIYQYKMNK